MATPPTDHQAERFFRRHIERLPRPLRHVLQGVRRPGRGWLRLPVALLLIAGGLLWFLPVLGLWMLPFGLLLLADDVPPVKRWLAGVLLRLEAWWARRRRA